MRIQNAAFIPPENKGPLLPSLRPKLSINSVTPILGDANPLLGGKLVLNPLGLGTKIDWSKYMADLAIPPPQIDWSKIPATPAVQPPQAPTIATLAPTAPIAPTAPAAPADTLAAKVASGLPAISPMGVVSGSWTVLRFGQTATQSQIAGGLAGVGFPSSSADQWADHILDLSHSHGFTSIGIGVVGGGLVVTGIGWLRPTMPARTKWAIGAVVAAVLSLLFYFLVPAESPFVGKWILDATSSHYAGDEPPRGESVTISADPAGLTVAADTVLANGKAAHLNYHLYPDGKEHPASPDLLKSGIETTRTTQKGNAVTTAFLKGGRVAATEERVVTADQKEMTVTSIRHAANGDIKDVLVFDRK